MRNLLAICLAAFTVAIPHLSRAATSPAPATVLLWPDGAPGALGSADEDKPQLTIFPAREGNTGAAVIIFPGGSYIGLSMRAEGSDVAEWLNRIGVNAFVLRYRLGPRYQHPIELGDAARAVRWVRTHSSEYGIDANRIGVWGFSAGGHLASTIGTHYDAGQTAAADPIDRAGSRPDFLVLAYPVIDPLGRAAAASFHNLLGEKADGDLVDSLSNDRNVTKDTPPTFLVAADDDPFVAPENSVNFYLALHEHGVPAELHLYRHGGHGFGMAPSDPALSTWLLLLSNWLKGSGFLQAK